MSPLRNALAAHLGQVLTPEVAAAIEGAEQEPSDQCIRLLDKWRRLIEPVIQSSPSPMPWDEVKKIPVQVYEGASSVLVVRLNVPMAFVWVAAGDLAEVLKLFSKAIADVRAAGCNSISYLGRAGWLRAAGFKQCAVYGTKEI